MVLSSIGVGRGSKKSFFLMLFILLTLINFIKCSSNDHLEVAKEKKRSVVIIKSVPPVPPVPSVPSVSSSPSFSESKKGNKKIQSFSNAKKLLLRNVYNGSVAMKTIYCDCLFDGDKNVNLKSCNYKVRKDKKRASKVEWEHIVPAQVFGKHFKEWNEGHPGCVHKGKKFKGRGCAAKLSPAFRYIEADMYNLYPSIGELNGDRKNYQMGNLSLKKSKEADTYTYCDQGTKIDSQLDMMEPADQYKGIIARTYLYMDDAYPGLGIVNNENRETFLEWDKKFPTTNMECERAKKILKLQGNENPILEKRCSF